MRPHRWWIAGAALVAVFAFFTRPTTAQPPALPQAVQGRYQLQVTGSAPNSTAFVIDTHPGQVWYRQTVPDVKTRTDMGSPAEKK